MAARGDKALYSTVQSWYNRINAALRYSDGITTLTVPAERSKILASNVNNLCTKLDSMKSDTYLRTHTYTAYSKVTRNTLIKAEDINKLSTVLNGLSKIKCGNNATNTNGMKSDGDKGNGTHDRGTKGNGSESNGPHGDSGMGKGTQSYGRRSNGSYSAGDQSNGSYSNGRRSNGRVIDIYNAQTTKANE